MPSACYNSFEDDVHRGNINPAADTFYMLLAPNTYTQDVDTHTRRSNVSEVTGVGYTAGGIPVTVTVTKDLVNNRVTLSLGGGSIPGATLTARYAIYYKRRGGAATADELVACIDFGSDVVASSGTFTVTASTIHIPNPV